MLQSRHQTPRRLASDEEPVTAGGYIRAHCHPKRFPAAYAHLGPTCGQPAQGSPSHAAQSPSMTHGSAADSDEGDAMAMRRYWGPRLLHVAGDHVVVSKPPGLQVGRGQGAIRWRWRVRPVGGSGSPDDNGTWEGNGLKQCNREGGSGS